MPLVNHSVRRPGGARDSGPWDDLSWRPLPLELPRAGSAHVPIWQPEDRGQSGGPLLPQSPSRPRSRNSASWGDGGREGEGVGQREEPLLEVFPSHFLVWSPEGALLSLPSEAQYLGSSRPVGSCQQPVQPTYLGFPWGRGLFWSFHRPFEGTGGVGGVVQG